MTTETKPAPLIDGDALIAQYLTLAAETTVTFTDGRATVLTPAGGVPTPCDPAYAVALDGAWKVTKWPFSTDEAALAAPGVDDRAWTEVQQPGKVFSLDVTKTIDDSPCDRVGLTHINPEDGAVLRRTLRLPAAWRGKRVRLRFDGIYPAGRVYVNGVCLGTHTSGLTPVEWDVTDLVTPGKAATVAVRLLRTHPFVKMDMPRHASEFAGLAQSACFFALEPAHIAAHHLIASLDDSLATGTVAGAVALANTGARAVAGTLTLAIRDTAGKAVAKQTVHVAIGAGAQCSVPMTARVKRPALWNDEFPHLYTLSLTLAVDGQPAQEVRFRIGFRRFDLTGGCPTLNGHPVKFRGVNHLTYHPEHGLYTPEAWLRQNLTLMKKANINCIRTHYLGPRVLADLCDELGLYLVQELPIDWGTNYIHDPAWVGPALQRIAGGILRDRDHASVMVWSVGNENMPESAAVAEDGHNHLRIYHRLAKALDPTRPTMFPPPGPANAIRGIFEVRVGDIADTHYSFNLAKDFLRTGVVTNPYAWTGEMETTTRDEAMARGWSGVFFSSEYGIQNLMPDLLFAPYGSIIDDARENPLSGKSSQQTFYERLQREWGFLRGEPTCLGGAYFPWICGAAGDNPWGWVVWAEDNDWGPVTADLTPKPEFWAMRVLFSPVWLPAQMRWAGEPSLRFSVENQFNAINLRDCTLRVLMGGGYGMSAGRWRDVPMACAPGATAVVEIPLWEGTLKALGNGSPCVVRCVLLDPKGFRTLTHDILVLPEAVADIHAPLAIGPDAVTE
jgi:hypothetical protein